MKIKESLKNIWKKIPKKAKVISALSILLAGLLIPKAIKLVKSSKIEKTPEKISIDEDKTIDTDTNLDTEKIEKEFEYLDNKEAGYTDDIGVSYTGNIDPNKIVEKDGKLYVDANSAAKSNSVGKTEIDTKGDTLTVTPQGQVVEKQEYYEVKNEEGIVVEQGTGTPETTEKFTPVENGEVVETEVIKEETTVTIKTTPVPTTTTTAPVTTTTQKTTTTTPKATTTTAIQDVYDSVQALVDGMVENGYSNEDIKAVLAQLDIPEEYYSNYLPKVKTLK